MPLINIKTNISVSKDQKDLVRKALGELIAVIPKESGEFLMVDFADNSPLSFGGSCEQPCAAADVRILQKVLDITPQEKLEAFLAAATEVLSKVLGIKPEHIFVLYTGSSMWACEGANIEKTLLKL